MLELRLSCEHCDKSLPPDSEEAMICTYECTFCSTCVNQILYNVCPNCGGGFEKRPIRPHAKLNKHPPRKDKVYHPVNMEKFLELLLKNRDVSPGKR